MGTNSETAVKDGMEDILSDTERATLEEAYKSKEEIPVTGPDGEVIGVWDWNEISIVRDGEIVARLDENAGIIHDGSLNEAQEKSAQKFVNEVDSYLKEEWSKKLAEFQKTEEYQKLNEEERIAALYHFEQEDGMPYYISNRSDVKLMSNSYVKDFRNTETYKNLNKAEKIIELCNLQVKCRDSDYSKETDIKAHMERCREDSDYYFADRYRIKAGIELSNGLRDGKFNAEEAAVAANWLRENYDARYDWSAVQQMVEKELLDDIIRGVKGAKTVDKNSPNAVPVMMGMGDTRVAGYIDANEADKAFSDAVRGKQNSVDAEATEGLLKAIDKDQTLSAEEKNQRKLEVARGYCDRVDEHYSDCTEKGKNEIKDNLLRYHPDLAAQLEREGTSGKMHDDRTSADNVGKIVEMNPEQGAKLVSNRVQEGAENAGVDTSISANEPKMNKVVEAKTVANEQSGTNRTINVAEVMRSQGASR